MKQGLIVDDSAVIRLVASKILEEFRFACAEVEGVDAALSFCEMTPPDLILLGAAGRASDNVNFLRRLRRTPGGDKPRVMLCVAENDEVAIGRALRAGADEVLFKPFDIDAVRERLQALGFVA